MSNQVIQCLVADDEPPAREILKRYIADTPMLHLAGECSNALQVIPFLQEREVDLLFLDIKMPQLSGIELLKILKYPPRVIFTTAHPEYALEGYELDIVDYLLKPVPFDRFIKAVNKVLQLKGHKPAVVPLPLPQEAGGKGFVYFRADRKMIKVFLDDILFIESMKDYVKVFTAAGVIITRQSMAALEAMLPSKNFIRTHRSFIVSLPKIKSFTGEMIDIEKGALYLSASFTKMK